LRHLLLFILSSICLSIVIAAIQKPKRIFEFPFLFTFGIILFILPTAWYIVNRTGLISDFVFSLMIFNVLICYLAGLFGYYFIIADNSEVKKPQWTLDLDLSFKVVLPIVVVSSLSYLYLVNLDIEGEWRGLPVYLLYVGRFIWPVIIVILVSLLIKPNKWKLIVLGISLIHPMYAMLFLGRRYEFGIVLISCATAYHLVTGWKPRRILIPTVLIVAIILFTILPVVREETKKGNFREVLEVELFHTLDLYFSGVKTNEFIEACYDLEGLYYSGEAGYGAGIWNGIIIQFIPGSIIGQERKAEFLLPTINMAEIRKEYSSSSEHFFYLAPLGFNSLFLEFRFFGFLFYFVVGVLFKLMIVHVRRYSHPFHMIMYSIFVISCMNITFGYLGYMITSTFPFIFVLILVKLFSSVSGFRMSNKKVVYLTEEQFDQIYQNEEQSTITT